MSKKNSGKYIGKSRLILWIAGLLIILNIAVFAFQIHVIIQSIQGNTTEAFPYQSVIQEQSEIGRSLVNDPYYYGIANPDFYPFLIYNEDSPIEGIPVLQELSLVAESDEEVVSNFVRFFNENRDELAIQFGESNSDRLGALVAMYIVHNSHPYGLNPIVTDNDSLLTYSQSSTSSQCYLQSKFQAELVEGLGLTWRIIGIGPLHIWLEVQIDGVWEIFDATSNIWLDAGIDELVNGETRNYRSFYSISLDADMFQGRIYAEELQSTHFKTIPGNQNLVLFHGGPAFFRSLTPGLGIYYPSPVVCESNVSLCIVTVTDRDTGVTSTSYDEFRIASSQ